MLRSARPKKKSQGLQKEFDNCKSLKKVLQKLETQHSPEKKQQHYIAAKENLDPPIISSARETAGISHYSGFNMSTVFKKFESLKK